MGKLVVSTFVTLDGVMEAPGGEDHPDGRGGWSMPYFSDDMGGAVFEGLESADALLLGRVTYEHFAAAWPSMTDDAGFADRMNGIPKHVVTSTLDELTWNARPLQGDPVTEVAKLKEADA